MSFIQPAAEQLIPARVNCLLVDDLDDNLLALSALLQSDSVRVFTARSGADALELLLEHDFALALLDVQMPQMDGFELAELMRGSERTRQVPIIFLTAGARDQHRQFKGYEAGGVDFIYKPVEPAVLRNKAEVFFALHRHRQQLASQLQERTTTLRWNEMFTAMLGHDLRNPLAAILASAEFIQASSPEDGTRRSAARIMSSAMRMTRMIDDLFDLSRSRLGGGIPIVRELTDLGGLVERVVQEHRAAQPDRQITLRREDPLSGHWDPNRLAQVVSNLIGNALVHGSEDGDVGVEVRAADDSSVELIVTNEGEITAEQRERIFDPFKGTQRRDTSSGLGLGLYIVEQITKAHGGRIDVRASEDGHVAFHVTIPRTLPA
ncbi:MAG: hybrid sensor histidine kinase/response regulator [Rudaea sp.]